MEGSDATVERPEGWTDEDWQEYCSVTRATGVPAGEASTVEVVEMDAEVEGAAEIKNIGGGAFIPELWVKVPTFDVAWGFGVVMDVSVGSPTNSGSATAPVARLPVTVTARVAGPQTDETTEWSFTLSGDGSWHAA